MNNCPLPHPTLFFKMAESTARSSAMSLSCLLKRFQLKEEDLKKQITDKHLDEISCTCCRKWKLLRSRIEMEEIVEHDIEKGPGDEEDKRRKFLRKWKNTKGSGATYEVLITALLEIKCVEDAECICKLLAPTGIVMITLLAKCSYTHVVILDHMHPLYTIAWSVSGLCPKACCSCTTF